MRKLRNRTTPPKPKAVLDLSGKGNRRPPPLQLHQAYSVRYFREDSDDSPLRKEVDGLWDNRKKPEVIELLSPFVLSESDWENRMLFHNAVMRQKCSELDDDKKRELQDWAEEESKKRVELVSHPWGALQTDAVDELTAENQHVQG